MLSLAMTSLVALVDVSNTQNITSDTFFYGQSPPVYPSRKPTLLPAFIKRSQYSLSFPTAIGTGTGNWSEAYKKAEAMVAQMTLDEKVRNYIYISEE
jgi:beta-glucosidase